MKSELQVPQEVFSVMSRNNRLFLILFLDQNDLPVYLFSIDFRPWLEIS
jgi:hypothetical protein